VPSGVATHEASDIKATGMPMPSSERDTVPDASRRLGQSRIFKKHISVI
jgi:hypothetical protein